MKLNFTTFAIVLLFHSALSRSSNKLQTFFLLEDDEGQDKLIVVTWNNGFDGITSCEVSTDETYINNVRTKSAKVNSNEFQQLLEECKDLEQPSRSPDAEDSTTTNPMQAPANGETTTEGYSGWNVIFPGTKWCGAGDIAKNYDDLGTYSDTDKCCRAHDFCDDMMAPGETKNNLTNSSPFTKLSCKCDNDFYDCLDNVDSVISNKIGNFYFNILRRDCYKADYPYTKKCKSFRSFLKITCKEYKKNTKVPKQYQWVKSRVYLKLPVPGPLTITLPFREQS